MMNYDQHNEALAVVPSGAHHEQDADMMDAGHAPLRWCTRAPADDALLPDDYAASAAALVAALEFDSSATVTAVPPHVSCAFYLVFSQPHDSAPQFGRTLAHYVLSRGPGTGISVYLVASPRDNVCGLREMCPRYLYVGQADDRLAPVLQRAAVAAKRRRETDDVWDTGDCAVVKRTKEVSGGVGQPEMDFKSAFEFFRRLCGPGPAAAKDMPQLGLRLVTATQLYFCVRTVPQSPSPLLTPVPNASVLLCRHGAAIFVSVLKGHRLHPDTVCAIQKRCWILVALDPAMEAHLARLLRQGMYNAGNPPPHARPGIGFTPYQFASAEEMSWLICDPDNMFAALFGWRRDDGGGALPADGPMVSLLVVPVASLRLFRDVVYVVVKHRQDERLSYAIAQDLSVDLSDSARPHGGAVGLVPAAVLPCMAAAGFPLVPLAEPRPQPEYDGFFPRQLVHMLNSRYSRHAVGFCHTAVAFWIFFAPSAPRNSHTTLVVYQTADELATLGVAFRFNPHLLHAVIPFEFNRVAFPASRVPGLFLFCHARDEMSSEAMLAHLVLPDDGSVRVRIFACHAPHVRELLEERVDFNVSHVFQTRCIVTPEHLCREPRQPQDGGFTYRNAVQQPPVPPADDDDAAPPATRSDSLRLSEGALTGHDIVGTLLNADITDVTRSAAWPGEAIIAIWAWRVPQQLDAAGEPARTGYVGTLLARPGPERPSRMPTRVNWRQHAARYVHSGSGTADGYWTGAEFHPVTEVHRRLLKAPSGSPGSGGEAGEPLAEEPQALGLGDAFTSARVDRIDLFVVRAGGDRGSAVRLMDLAQQIYPGAELFVLRADSKEALLRRYAFRCYLACGVDHEGLPSATARERAEALYDVGDDETVRVDLGALALQEHRQASLRLEQARPPGTQLIVHGGDRNLDDGRTPRPPPGHTERVQHLVMAPSPSSPSGTALVPRTFWARRGLPAPHDVLCQRFARDYMQGFLCLHLEENANVSAALVAPFYTRRGTDDDARCADGFRELCSVPGRLFLIVAPVPPRMQPQFAPRVQLLAFTRAHFVGTANGDGEEAVPQHLYLVYVVLRAPAPMRGLVAGLQLAARYRVEVLEFESQQQAARMQFALRAPPAIVNCACAGGGEVGASGCQLEVPVGNLPTYVELAMPTHRGLIDLDRLHRALLMSERAVWRSGLRAAGGLDPYRLPGEVLVRAGDVVRGAFAAAATPRDAQHALRRYMASEAGARVGVRTLLLLARLCGASEEDVQGLFQMASQPYLPEHCQEPPLLPIHMPFTMARLLPMDARNARVNLERHALNAELPPLAFPDTPALDVVGATRINLAYALMNTVPQVPGLFGLVCSAATMQVRALVGLPVDSFVGTPVLGQRAAWMRALIHDAAAAAHVCLRQPTGVVTYTPGGYSKAPPGSKLTTQPPAALSHRGAVRQALVREQQARPAAYRLGLLSDRSAGGREVGIHEQLALLNALASHPDDPVSAEFTEPGVTFVGCYDYPPFDVTGRPVDTYSPQVAAACCVAYLAYTAMLVLHGRASAVDFFGLGRLFTHLQPCLVRALRMVPPAALTDLVLEYNPAERASLVGRETCMVPVTFAGPCQPPPALWSIFSVWLQADVVTSTFPLWALPILEQLAAAWPSICTCLQPALPLCLPHFEVQVVYEPLLAHDPYVVAQLLARGGPPSHDQPPPPVGGAGALPPPLAPLGLANTLMELGRAYGLPFATHSPDGAYFSAYFLLLGLCDDVRAGTLDTARALARLREDPVWKYVVLPDCVRRRVLQGRAALQAATATTKKRGRGGTGGASSSDAGAAAALPSLLCLNSDTTAPFTESLAQEELYHLSIYAQIHQKNAFDTMVYNAAMLLTATPTPEI